MLKQWYSDYRKSIPVKIKDVKIPDSIFMFILLAEFSRKFSVGDIKLMAIGLGVLKEIPETITYKQLKEICIAYYDYTFNVIFHIVYDPITKEESLIDIILCDE